MAIPEQVVSSKRKRRLLGGALLLAALLAGLAIYVTGALSPVTPADQARDVSLTVPRNASSAIIGGLLQTRGLIRNARVFNLYVRLKGVGGRLKAGRYSLSTGMSLSRITDLLVKGPPDAREFTVPEGFTLHQIAALLTKQGLTTHDRFFQAVARDQFDYPFLAGLPPGPHRLEGYLFPDTYKVGSDISTHDLIDMMLGQFNDEMKKLNYEQKARAAGLTLHQAVIIASMVEREAKVNRERPVIAGVIENRLHRGMPLQVDATVQYALGSQRSKLYYKDLEVKSPYNTYKITGLPPGPIACPGEASLLAAVEPAHTNYLYYVAKPDGTHAFAVTLAQHEANKRKYLR
ncbi:endolytic transglycosylase MltG [Desulfotomaculum copahuensis]|uniref:Endolytic murein transglycosylase n=1 Tax=Desulfotomaculum copahuensis TaxID=1838280 RepID=A0A1B7LEC0_9FIRM|nr:endolytic transglycosylase MltG [Desulfotomaculum copahuensis]OAT81441.1 aminodeoxychorismate lyase [Desulfotomaculum copahuensis]